MRDGSRNEALLLAGESLVGIRGTSDSAGPPDLDGRFDRHPRPQQLLEVLPIAEQNLDRDALDDFHVVSRGVLGRQQAVPCTRDGGNAVYVAIVLTAERVH